MVIFPLKMVIFHSYVKLQQLVIQPPEPPWSPEARQLGIEELHGSLAGAPGTREWQVIDDDDVDDDYYAYHHYYCYVSIIVVTIINIIIILLLLSLLSSLSLLLFSLIIIIIIAIIAIVVTLYSYCNFHGLCYLL